MNRRTLFQALIGSAAATTVAASEQSVVVEIGFDTEAYLEAVNQIPLGPFITINGENQGMLGRPFGYGISETFVTVRPTSAPIT